MLKLLHSYTNQELYIKHLCNQSGHYDRYEWRYMPHLQMWHPQLSPEK